MQIVLLFPRHDRVESALIHQCSKNPKELLVVTELPLQEKCNIFSGQFWKQSVLEYFFCNHAIEVFLQNQK